MPAISRSLNVLARVGNLYRGEGLEKIGLNPWQAPYILHIHYHPGRSQEELARALHINPSTAARQVAHLMEAGFITREVCKTDKRRMELFPTEQAQAAVPLIHQINAGWNSVLCQNLEGNELQRLEDLLQKLLAGARAWEESRP